MTLVPPKDTKRLLKRLTNQYWKDGQESPAETYLRQRGITKEAQNYFHLGFVKDPEPAERAYEGMLSIPYITANGDVVGIKYRYLDDRKSKYRSSLGFEAKRMFNPFVLTQRHSRIYITEGELDTVVLKQIGVPSIAIPGATNWTVAAARALRNREVVVLADGDDSNEEGLNLGKRICKDVDNASLVLMYGTDVNQFFLDNGKDELLTYIGWVDDRSRQG